MPQYLNRVVNMFKNKSHNNNIVFPLFAKFLKKCFDNLTCAVWIFVLKISNYCTQTPLIQHADEKTWKKYR